MSADSEPPAKKQKRSRSGCLTCRADKKKCDEEHPQCGRCEKMSYDCVWPTSTAEKPGERWRPPPRRLQLLTAVSPISTSEDGLSNATAPLSLYPDERAWVANLPVLPSPTYSVPVPQDTAPQPSQDDYIPPLQETNSSSRPDTVLSEGELLDLLKGLPK